MFGYECLQANHPDDSAHAVATSININSIPTSIASAYFPPGSPFPTEDLSLFLQTLNHTYVIGADFNAKHETWGCHSKNTRGLATQENYKSLITPEIRELISQKRRARNTWQRTHYPIDKQRINLPFPPLIHQNNKLATTDQEKIDFLANHLANTFKPHNIFPDATHTREVDQFISSPLLMALPASPTTPGEVLPIIKTLKKNKSPGHDHINNTTVKNLPPKTIILLTYIFNAIFRLSHFPTTWKSALIITILKPGKQPDMPESYRPISLLLTLGKIFEKLFLKRLVKIALTQNALPNFQFGFRAKHATFHQLHRVVDHITTSLETKKYFSGLFLDVAQAFDTFWHDGLLFKLKKIFPAPYYLLLKSYLNNRTFRVKLKTTLSSTHNILAGVSQGSDIAPFLYILFTADIPSTDNTLIGTYADDIAILSSSQEPHEASGLLQNHLNSLSNWFNSWKIKINDSKSSHITFSLRPGNCPHIIYENAIIPHTNEAKYLGLLFDRRLTWSPHLKTKRKQLNSHLHILRPLMKSNMSISNRLLL
ncbi:Endonuclease/exonuclease/phosphatase,Reverse transcriptase domain [Cinara cedri]|uniref:Endonuclease/exonuclease/phosphatase,Reverse transcriptase domain n=1 Tax=Cinara cedri TaxID=506608 RepID=A0A5E4N974_9HEMI|nr:Endonuclease/exonuclease/phosphatase,Reverse transcriptase domain [Cinara cedri]